MGILLISICIAVGAGIWPINRLALSKGVRQIKLAKYTSLIGGSVSLIIGLFSLPALPSYPCIIISVLTGVAVYSSLFYMYKCISLGATTLASSVFNIALIMPVLCEWIFFHQEVSVTVTGVVGILLIITSLSFSLFTGLKNGLSKKIL